MKLEQIIYGMQIADRRGRLDCEIDEITFDSRKVRRGSLYVAIRGHRSDGHDYIKQAVRRGAMAVLCEEWPKDVDAPDLQVVVVPDTRRALSLSAANFYSQPSRKLLLAGVTGTNGKTTVAYTLASIFRAASSDVGLISTVECRYGGKSFPLEHTTPEPVRLQSILADMVQVGVRHVAMEVSSHALEQQRVAGMHFKVAGFTNLTQDHLDYHQSMDAYFKAKARLFSEVLRRSRARGRMAVVNVDDPRGTELIGLWGGKSLKVSLDPKSGADVCALEAHYSLSGIRAVVRTPKGQWELEVPLLGAHNLSNVLVATGIALAMGFSRARIMRGLRSMERVPGRLERVPSEDARHVFVDYAHTPDALTKVLSAMRPLTKGRLIVVFGCGGDRDREKRPIMGRVVAEGADYAILTSDNPRSEDPLAIIGAIEPGLTGVGFSKEERGEGLARSYRIEPERRAALRRAIKMLEPDDVLIVAGKGHESYQISGSQKLRFDDRDEARRILAGLPPPPPEVIELASAPEDGLHVDDAPETTVSASNEVVLSELYDAPEASAEVSLSDIEAVVDAEEQRKLAELRAVSQPRIEPADPTGVLKLADVLAQKKTEQEDEP